MRPFLLAVLLASLSLLAPTVPGQPSDRREAWLYSVGGKKGWLEKSAGKSWIETTTDGPQLGFQEVARTPQYVELYDRSRGFWLRLHGEFCELRVGDKGGWNRLYNGRWVRPADLPRPKPVKGDYRVRLVYFVPGDRKPIADYEKRIRVVMRVVAEVYKQDADARGIRSAGLRFQSKAGEPIVHLVRGKRPAAFYNGAPSYLDIRKNRRTITG